MHSSKPYWLSIDLIEKIPVIGLLKAIYHYLTNDKQKFKRCLIKQSKIFINVVKIVPGLGHSIGIICYFFQEKEVGDNFIKSSSRSLLCLSSGVIFGIFINKSFEELFQPFKITKEIFFCSVLGLSVGFLFDYANTFQKNIEISEKISGVELKKNVFLYFPFGFMKNYEKFKQKPNKKLKYIAKMGIRAFLYVGCGAIGLYFCSKIEKNLYGYIYGEFKKYLALSSCLVFLLF